MTEVPNFEFSKYPKQDAVHPRWIKTNVENTGLQVAILTTVIRELQDEVAALKLAANTPVITAETPGRNKPGPKPKTDTE